MAASLRRGSVANARGAARTAREATLAQTALADALMEQARYGHRRLKQLYRPIVAEPCLEQGREQRVSVRLYGSPEVLRISGKRHQNDRALPTAV